ncbi:TetR/AcrR family transcriptional regulator [Sphingomonas sp. A2-49]|uniref:TetR/AcrR family transcriptional regulator n=1 Tax=Sphingomonas sp. A2-49 TaxID=1391375 RepID=UPI0021CEC2AD|nr:TetR/AcrR family transcriptional regulator [Sphingomonas sp. A2-49]MCU6455721.1 TetR/AcrR family transcriptional regulator [Sphingomonas sp. A2-49]
MECASTRPKRRTRADAARNRERLLAAAKAVFAQTGTGASLDAVARAAGLGIGTLYRHFPTRESLYEAVYRRDIEQLLDLAAAAASADAAVAALRDWLHAMVGMVATKKGMIAAFALAADTTTAISARSTGALTQALDGLLAHAVRTGAIRPGIGGEDLLLAVIGMCMLRNQPDWQDGVLRLVDALIDGMAVAGD